MLNKLQIEEICITTQSFKWWVEVAVTRITAVTKIGNGETFSEVMSGVWWVDVWLTLRNLAENSRITQMFGLVRLNVLANWQQKDINQTHGE